MKRDWKPGDVATREGRRVMRVGANAACQIDHTSDPHWHLANGLCADDYWEREEAVTCAHP